MEMAFKTRPFCYSTATPIRGLSSLRKRSAELAVVGAALVGLN
jgi:hypothetical protein